MNTVVPLLWLAGLAFAYDFFSNVYVKMLFYALFAVNLSMFVARFNLVLGIAALVAACVLAPFSLAFKLFILGSGLAMVRGGLHGRSSSMLDTIGGISIFAGIVLGIYGFFAG